MTACARTGARWAPLLLAALVAGCAARGPLLERTLPGGGASGGDVELASTPFFPQQKYQCGPAALATVLVASGVDTDADALVPQVYLPERRGSLQAELVAATRRHDRVPYPVEGDLAGLHRALKERYPVLVLLNLGIGPLPVWHYAVVVGFDVDGDRVLLRSGTERRRAMAAHRFDAAWRRAGRWGLVVAAPGEVPGMARPDRWLKAAAGLESAGRLAAAEAAYRASLERWPERPRAVFGLGNVRYRQGHPREAATFYRRYLEQAPKDAAAWNNLASAQLELGDLDAAHRALARASALASPPDVDAAIAATRAELDAAAGRR